MCGIIIHYNKNVLLSSNFHRKIIYESSFFFPGKLLLCQSILVEHLQWFKSIAIIFLPTSICCYNYRW